ncbi:hypothetical protein KA005_38150 [bacterium]|nr:hypothetical protein [bacterium]
MTISKLAIVPKIRFHEPERNLPGRRPRASTAETRFTIKFAKVYIKKHISIHQRSKKNETACARQLAINGFGIADIVSVSWESKKRIKSMLTVDEFLNNVKPTVRAFEVKLSNWRKGLTQAHRYRYFSNAAILVMPNNKISSALKYLNTFKKINVGLWAFDVDSQRIIPYYTPRPSSALMAKHSRRAIQIIANTSKVLPFVQKP